MTETDQAWERFCAEHIRPSAIFSIAVGMRTPTYEERNHLERCVNCRSALGRYRRNNVGDYDAKKEEEVELD